MLLPLVTSCNKLPPPEIKISVFHIARNIFIPSNLEIVFTSNSSFVAFGFPEITVISGF